MTTQNQAPLTMVYETQSKIPPAPAPDTGWLPPSFTQTFEVKNFIEDLRQYSGETEITAQFRENNPYLNHYLCSLGNLSLLKPWFNMDNQVLAEELLVKPLKEREQKMREMECTPEDIHQELKRSTYFILSQALRNSPEQEVRELAELASSLWPEAKAFIEGKEDAFKSFARWGCQIARYRKPKDLNGLKSRYSPKESGLILLAEEIAFGEKSYQESEEALQLCMNKEAVPSNKDLDFLNTKPERQGLRIAVEYMIERHYQNALARKNEATAVKMKTIRHVICYTPLEPYDWAKPLVEEMLALARSGTISDLIPDDYEGQSAPGYACTYMNYMVHKYFPEAPDYDPNKSDDPNHWHKKNRWDHGVLSLDALWARLEDLHHEIMNMTVNTNNKASLLAFYDKVIEATWLLGNQTPTLRGTGKIVEQTLTMYHLRHQLRTPLLRLEYPQIDVLNITLPLSEYKKRFFDYFEPETFPRKIIEPELNPPEVFLDQKRQEVVPQFDLALQVIQTRYDQLVTKKGKEYEDLRKNIEEALQGLTGIREEYLEKTIATAEADQQAYAEFKEQCKGLIDPLKPQLETHRGLKGSLLIQLLMTAINALLAIFSNKWNKTSFFHHRTKTAESFDPLVHRFENDFKNEPTLAF